MTEPDQPAAGPPGSAGLAGSTGLTGSAGRPAVLVARDPGRASGLLTLLRERGLDPVAAPVIERASVENPAELDAARERLAAGEYAWVAITSVNAVDALLGPATDDAGAVGDDTMSAGSVAQGRQRLPRATHSSALSSPPGDTPAPAGPVAAERVRWAAVGPATRRALTARGVVVDLVPSVATGDGLAEAFPAAPGVPVPGEAPGPAGVGRDTAPRVLLPLGDLASDTLRTGLEARGWAVDTVTAYRTIARELPEQLRRRYDVVVVSSGSAARQVAAQLGPQRVVAIGEPSARAAGAVGHAVLAVAETPTNAALADAVTTALAVSATVAPKPDT